jgi:indolepyruvate ferredoxin oxidoreductase beta subunit
VDIAESLGNGKSMNVVLFGALVKAMNLSEIDWEKKILDNVKPAFVDLNIKAFRAGMAV